MGALANEKNPCMKARCEPVSFRVIDCMQCFNILFEDAGGRQVGMYHGTYCIHSIIFKPASTRQMYVHFPKS